MHKNIRRSSKSKIKLSISSILMVIGGFVLICGLYLTLRPKSNDIFVINDGGMPVPVYSGSPTTICNPQVSSLTFTESCGSGKYRYVTNMRCLGSESLSNFGSVNDCKDMTTWYSEALAICQKKLCPSANPSSNLSPKPSPIACSLSIVKYREICNMLTRATRYVDYTCFAGDKIRTQGGSTSCKPQYIWKSYAQQDCNRVCASPSPSVIPSPITSTKPSPISICYEQQLTHYAYREICSSPSGSGTLYHYLDYTCGGESQPRTVGSADLCQTNSSLIRSAQDVCRKNLCLVSPTPTPTPTPVPTSIPMPTPIQ